MARYIDAEKLLVKIKSRHTVRYFTPTKEELQLIDIFEIINTQPAADVVEVKHGEWKQCLCFDRFYYCSECNRRIEDATKRPFEHFPYCHCGAKMDGTQKERGVEKVKKTVVFDFDGVIHSYTSGWKGIDVIPDDPVDGISEAIDNIRNAGYEVVVVSTRCKEEKGVEAIKHWLCKWCIDVDAVMAEKPPCIDIIHVDQKK